MRWVLVGGLVAIALGYFYLRGRQQVAVPGVTVGPAPTPGGGTFTAWQPVLPGVTTAPVAGPTTEARSGRGHF